MEETAEQKTSGYGKRPMWQWTAIYLVIAVILYGAFYYFVLAKKGGSNSNQSNPYSTGQNAAPTSANPQESSSTNAQKITVEGNEFAFTPSTISAKNGEPLEITFKNTGKFPHNLTIADLNVATKTIQPGEQDIVQVTPSKTGSFSFVCTVDSHADKGMKGTLTVQ